MAAGTISVEGLSKRYRLGARRQQFPTLRDAIADWASPSRWIARRQGLSDAAIWALRDVSFSVAPGEIVGLIGPNGAGKTTLLKILSRITEPTGGAAELRGRVGSLLEVGTGFHPELSGRENIYLNGAVLGMRRAEIRRRFDEIVAFAEVEAFLDTPVKRYSSGMAVRLAFSVAAHLDLEIMLVDEVLAVGDAAFQRKSLGKMGDVASEGRTVLFVSHNMAVVQAFCERGIVLRSGEIEVDASITEAVTMYLSGLEAAADADLAERRDRRGRRDSVVRAIEIRGGDGLANGTLVSGARASLTFHLTEVQRGMSLSFVILDMLGRPVTHLSSLHLAEQDLEAGDAREFVCEIPALPLVPGRYRIDFSLRGAGRTQDRVEAATFFNVEEGIFHGRAVPRGDWEGSTFVAHRWIRPKG